LKKAVSVMTLIFPIFSMIALVFYTSAIEMPMVFANSEMITISVLIDYGNGSVKWCDRLVLPQTSTIFNATLVVATVDYTDYGSLGIFLDAIDNVWSNSSFYWSSWFWNFTECKWMMVEVPFNSYSLHHGEIIAWHYAEGWPPPFPSMPLTRTIEVPTDYSTIQEAINNANVGDTVFVRNGTYLEHVVVSKSLSLIGENKSTTIIDGNLSETVMNITADNANVTGFTIQRSGNFSAFDNYDCGICLFFSNGSEIRDTIVKDNCVGIWAFSSENSFLENNTAIGNDYGILLVYSTNIRLRGNKMVGNRYNFVMGLSDVFLHFIQDIDTSNTVNDRPIYYLANQRNTQVPQDGGCVIVVNSTDVQVRTQNISKNGCGVLLAYTRNSTVQNVTVTNNNCGIWLHNSSNNTVDDNSIVNNTLGIALYCSDNNSISHNAFVKNAKQTYNYDSANVWDKVYPYGGNFWSDYNGSDSCGGSSQNDPSYFDFIGDSPYVIDMNNTDHYPLMLPLINWQAHCDNFFLVFGDSMAPTIRPNDLIFIRNITGQSEIRAAPFPEGDLIVHKHPGNPAIYIVRRAIEKWYENDTWYFTVKSDNRTEDVNITINLIIGKVVNLMRRFDVTIDGKTHNPTILTNSTLDSLVFNELTKRLYFNVTGLLAQATTSGCDIFIPKAIFSDGFEVMVENSPVPFSKTDYGRLSLVFFETFHTSYNASLFGLHISTYTFQVNVDEVTFNVLAETNSAVSNFTFSIDNKTITINVEGLSDTTGFCNVTLPTNLLGGPYTVKVDNATVLEDYGAPTNGTHASIYFIYDHSLHMVKIIGTTAIPEFSSFIIIPLFMLVTILMTVVCKRKHIKNSKIPSDVRYHGESVCSMIARAHPSQKLLITQQRQTLTHLSQPSKTFQHLKPTQPKPQKPSVTNKQNKTNRTKTLGGV